MQAHSVSGSKANTRMLFVRCQNILWLVSSIVMTKSRKKDVFVPKASPCAVAGGLLYGVCLFTVLRVHRDALTWLLAKRKANRIFRGAGTEPTKPCLNPEVWLWNRLSLAVWDDGVDECYLVLGCGQSLRQLQLQDLTPAGRVSCRTHTWGHTTPDRHHETSQLWLEPFNRSYRRLWWCIMRWGCLLLLDDVQSITCVGHSSWYT